MRAGYSERKEEILDLLDGGPKTASDISESCGIGEQTARNLLNRYRKQGLVRRKIGKMIPRGGSKPNKWSISEKGRKRLSFF